ncbi:MAG TPA: DUF4968 domain-containing protein, partial [Candidatus Acidoferrales bacterium]|nr:DUF4968 domain-containing protein [Candidatus Acidoferrales bacterium]
MKRLFVALVLVSCSAAVPSIARAQWTPLNPVTGVEKQADGVLLKMHQGVLRLQVCSDSIVHVIYAPGSSIPDVRQFIVTKTTWPPAQWNMDQSHDAVTLTTSRMKITVTRANGVIR